MALQHQPTHDHLLSISHPDMDNEDAQSTDWLDSTNHNVVAVLTDQVGDPWNHPLMMIDHYHAAEEASKRVSLDATETWMTDQDGDDMFLGTLDTSDPILMAHHHHDGEFAALPSSISFQPDDNDLHLMSMDDGDDNHHHQYNGISHSNQHDHHSSNDNDDWSDDSWNSQFRERRAQLAASMQASQSTRNLISKHVQTRASLQQVLQEIEKSATQVRQHIVETVGMAVDEEPEQQEQQEPDVEPEPMPDVEPSSSSSDGNVDDNGNTLQVATEPSAAAAASNPEKPAAV